MSEWASRPQLATALVQANQELLVDAGAEAAQEKAHRLLRERSNK
jgi:hypothetical protein